MTRMNRGYRVQHSSAIGPFMAACFHPGWISQC